MQKTYTERIFGTALEVKNLFMRELTEELAKRDMVPETFDSILRRISPRASEWPNVRQMIEDPKLFSPSYNQLVARATLGGDSVGGQQEIFPLTGFYLREKIREFLSDPTELDIVIDNFKLSGGTLHVSHPNPVRQIEALLQGERIHDLSPNTVPKDVLGETLLHMTILRELEQVEC